jgi:hypothetical protein
MRISDMKPGFIFIVLIYLSFNCIVGSTYGVNNASANLEGYRAIIPLDNGFLAAASEGRLDWISESGKISKSEKFNGESFHCLLSSNRNIIVAGKKGSILISSDKGVFKRINSGTDRNINSLVLFKEKIIAGTDNGEILIGNETDLFKKIHLNLKGNIVSLSARTGQCYGVTDEGEIIHSKDGLDWTIFDFNAVYLGFYKPCYFTRILVTENQIAVTGKQNDGSPVLMFSTMGNVWSVRPLNYTDEEGKISTLTEIPNDLFYDYSKDQFILICNKGKMLTIPSCSHCNKLIEISTNSLERITGNEDTMMIIGENQFINVIKTK